MLWRGRGALKSDAALRVLRHITGIATKRIYLDRTLFWTTVDLENKLLEFRDYFNGYRTHHSLEGRTPDQDTTGPRPVANLNSYRWQPHCRGLYQTPIAA
jgi:putative transposase